MSSWTEDLPKQGPFKVDTSRLMRKTLKSIGLGVLVFAFGIGFLAFGIVVTQGILRTRQIWAEGVETPPQAVTYGGEITSHYFIFYQYDLNVTYLHPEAGPQTFGADFFRFVTGPDEDDAISVRALADDPSAAVTSWQYDALPHGAVWGLLIFAISALGVFGGITIIVNDYKKRQLIFRLAQRGQIERAEVKEATTSEANGVVTVTLEVRLPRVDVSHTLTYQQGVDDPVLVSDDKGQGVVLLASADGQETYLLGTDGFPLKLGLSPFS